MTIMSNKQASFGIAHRLAIESQLLAEEKWIVEALKKIQKQRNRLEVERLHLASEQSRLRRNRGDTEPSTVISHTLDAVSLMQQAPAITFEVSIVEDVCNGEELNLTVPHHTYHAASTNMEEVEEFDNDHNDLEDMAIDMNMFMNSLREDDDEDKES